MMHPSQSAKSKSRGLASTPCFAFRISEWPFSDVERTGGGEKQDRMRGVLRNWKMADLPQSPSALVARHTST